MVFVAGPLFIPLEGENFPDLAADYSSLVRSLAAPEYLHTPQVVTGVVMAYAGRRLRPPSPIQESVCAAVTMLPAESLQDIPLEVLVELLSERWLPSPSPTQSREKLIATISCETARRKETKQKFSRQQLLLLFSVVSDDALESRVLMSLTNTLHKPLQPMEISCLVRGVQRLLRKPLVASGGRAFRASLSNALLPRLYREEDYAHHASSAFLYLTLWSATNPRQCTRHPKAISNLAEKIAPQVTMSTLPILMRVTDMESERGRKVLEITLDRVVQEIRANSTSPLGLSCVVEVCHEVCRLKVEGFIFPPYGEALMTMGRMLSDPVRSQSYKMQPYLLRVVNLLLKHASWRQDPNIETVICTCLHLYDGPAFRKWFPTLLSLDLEKYGDIIAAFMLKNQEEVVSFLQDYFTTIVDVLRFVKLLNLARPPTIQTFEMTLVEALESRLLKAGTELSLEVLEFCISRSSWLSPAAQQVVCTRVIENFMSFPFTLHHVGQLARLLLRSSNPVIHLMGRNLFEQCLANVEHVLFPRDAEACYWALRLILSVPQSEAFQAPISFLAKVLAVSVDRIPLLLALPLVALGRMHSCGVIEPFQWAVLVRRVAEASEETRTQIQLDNVVMEQLTLEERDRVVYGFVHQVQSQSLKAETLCALACFVPKKQRCNLVPLIESWCHATTSLTKSRIETDDPAVFKTLVMSIDTPQDFQRCWDLLCPVLEKSLLETPGPWNGATLVDLHSACRREGSHVTKEWIDRWLFRPLCWAWERQLRYNDHHARTELMHITPTLSNKSALFRALMKRTFK